MENLDLLLTDEYVEFSRKIAEIHAMKKSLKEEMKKKYEEFQAHLKELDAQAQTAVGHWEEWKQNNPPEKKKEKHEAR